LTAVLRLIYVATTVACRGSIVLVRDLMLLLVGIAVAAALVAWSLFGTDWLLKWYLHEARRIEIAQAPGEAAISYPLA